MEDKKDAVGAVINEIYGIASELSISSDKVAQGFGKQIERCSNNWSIILQQRIRLLTNCILP